MDPETLYMLLYRLFVSPRWQAVPPPQIFLVSNSTTDCCQGIAKAASFPSPPRSNGFMWCFPNLLVSCPENVGSEMKCIGGRKSQATTVQRGRFNFWCLGWWILLCIVLEIKLEENLWSSAVQMPFASHIYLACCSRHGPQSNLFHWSDGFIEELGKTNLKIAIVRVDAGRVSYGWKMGLLAYGKWIDVT